MHSICSILYIWNIGTVGHISSRFLLEFNSSELKMFKTDKKTCTMFLMMHADNDDDIFTSYTAALFKPNF